MAKARPIPPTRDGHRKQLIDLLRQNTYRYDIHTIWSDFVEMGAIAFSNAVDLAHREEREAQYMRIIGKYQPDEVTGFAQALGALTMTMEMAVFDDVLGGVFMELELGNKWTGQFFTPYELCLLMAKLNAGDAMQERIEQQGFVIANDPCTGGGAMIIGLANAMHDAGINYQRHLHVVAQDLDIRSVHMAYLQFSLLHIPAVVIHGNTLALEERSHWYTPAHILGNWSARLRRVEGQPEPLQVTPPAVEPAHQFNLFEEAAA